MPVSKCKRYLSGSDWVINTLDHLMKSATCAGNMSQVAFMLDSRLDEHALRSRLSDFIRQFPVLEGTVGRDWTLAPYWKIPTRAGRNVALSVHHEDETSLDAFLPHLEKSANTPFQDDVEHVAFHLFTNRRQSIFAMTFDHRIFDARGAELFLNLFQQSIHAASPPPAGDIAFESTAGLTQWSRKFQAGRNVNRRIMALSKSFIPEALPMSCQGNGCYRYHLLSFTEQETAGIYERAYQEAGYLMESPYILAVILQSMHQLFLNRPGTGAGYLVPVTMDLRPGRNPVQEIFFNYVSYLFYQVPIQEVADRAGLIALLKQQMYDQVKSGFPRDLAEASLLTRIAPLPLLGKLLHLPMKGKMATFAFSHLGKSSYQQKEFMGSRVNNVFHMPRVPVPPGLGFFSSVFNSRLNLVISSLDGLLDPDDMNMLISGIRDRFASGTAS